jgi:DnaJ-domain-containing protein 1
MALNESDAERYYAVLGVRYRATIEQLKQARNQLARDWHPDRFTTAAAKATTESKMKAINLAYDFLKTYEPFVTPYEAATRESTPDPSVGGCK